ncbi:T9SS type A sorting domain-containing protein [Neptunitalea lumnitzerae]|uniref:Por secretion system C-terminal sorting domain-containing protein n=1 Tax=Neptunitalea lumnitzerae TaxID=2965509 RepID=A0ABQ5MGS4_9FLAO|nr:T9SS type A sorting domain-containing protein [Neptunitalea sp. Y10]GLB48506.1 hypothetical protein Y10_08740 [Neptunitalea sp. Y10]
MKKIYSLFLLLLVTTVSFAQDIAVNGDFESWTGGVLDTWTSESGTTITQETSTVSQGTYAANFEVTTATQGNTDFRQTVDIVAGTTYVVSVDIYQVDADSRARLYVDGYYSYSDPALVGTWQTITHEFTATADASIEVGLRFYDTDTFTTSSNIIVDNYTVIAQSTPSLAITNPTDGDLITSGDVTIEFTVANFAVANGSGDGHIHYTIDGGATVMQYDLNSIALTGLTDGSHTVDMELVDNNHNPLSPAVTASVSFTVTTGATQIADIAALKAAFANDNSTTTIYELQSTPVVTYSRVISAGTQIYLEDTTGGILIWDAGSSVLSTMIEGDVVSDLTGTLLDYNGVLELIPTEDPSTTAGTPITPTSIDIATLLTDWDMYESMLVSISNVTFTDADGSATFASSSNYTINDGSAITFRTNFSEADYIGEVIPYTANNLQVLVSEYNGSPQVYARSLSDFMLANDTFNNVTFKVYPNPVTNGTLHISSTVATDMNVQIYDLLGKQVVNKTVTNNTVNVSALQRGVYILQITQGAASTTQKLVIK